MYIIIIMKLKQVGQKLHDFKNYIGNKTYGGIKSLGNKIYDNRYKIGAGLGAIALTAGSSLLNNYMSKSAPTTLKNTQVVDKIVDNTDYPSLIDNRQVIPRITVNPLFGLN